MISSFSERLKELRAEKGIRSEDAAEVYGQGAGGLLYFGVLQKNFSKEYVSLLGQSELSGTAALAQCVTQLVSQIYGMNFCPEKEELFDKTDEAIKSAVDEHIKELKEALRAAKRDDKSDAGEIALELKFFEVYRERYFS